MPLSAKKQAEKDAKNSAERQNIPYEGFSTKRYNTDRGPFLDDIRAEQAKARKAAKENK